MKQTNCPNCSAPYEADLNKCPYCGTNYFDLSFIDFSTKEPFYIKIKNTFKQSNKECPGIVTMRVLPEVMNANMETDTYYYTYGTHFNETLTIGSTLSLKLGFTGIPDKNGRFMTIELGE